MQARLGMALAGVAAAAVPFGAGAAIVSVADLEKSIAQGETYSLPGISDIAFSWPSNLKIQAVNGASFGSGTFGAYPGFVAAGVTVGAGAGEYQPTFGGFFFGGGTFSGTGTDEGYLGLSFQLADGTHYGWVELTVTGTPLAPSMTIHGYGYEDAVGVSIATGATAAVPEPGTLALAAAGALAAVGAGRVRRRKSAGH